MVIDRDVEALIVAAEKLTVPLRMRQGLDEAAYDSLRQALRVCADAWRERDTVPKVAANVLVDLAPAIEASSYLYSDDYRARVQQAAVEIGDLVRACVAV